MEATAYVCKTERLWQYLDVGWIGHILNSAPTPVAPALFWPEPWQQAPARFWTASLSVNLTILSGWNCVLLASCPGAYVPLRTCLASAVVREEYWGIDTPWGNPWPTELGAVKHMLLSPFPGRKSGDKVIEHPIACRVGQLDITSLK